MSIIISYSDVVYFASLLACMSLGGFYKQITNKDTKRNYGAGVGILVTYMICGHQIYHSILLVWGNIIVLKCCDKRYVHQISLAYTWTYLAYMRFNIDVKGFPYELWIHQTIALRLVGLAFEIYLTERMKLDGAKPQGSKMALFSPEDVDEEPQAIDIIAYAYFFIGLHRGPFYRWKIYKDHFKSPYGTLGDCRIITEQKLKKAMAFTAVYMLLRTLFPLETYFTDRFYKHYGTDNRFLYNIPQLFMFCLHYQIVMMLCTSVCTETGFGVYPAKCLPVPGHGPTAKPSLLKLTSTNRDAALEQEYNFGMLKSFDNTKLLFGPSMRDTLRAWDMSTQYWFWAHTYKSIIKSKKEVRNALSFLAWTLWCGPSAQQLIFASTLWVHVHLESEYTHLYTESIANMKTPWDIGLSIMRFICLTYLTPCLVLQDHTLVFRYYNSIYWMYHFVLLSLILLAVVISKFKLNTTVR